MRLPQSAIVDSQGFATSAKAILTNSLENLFAFQSSRRAESISVNRFARPGAGFRTRNPGSGANGDRAMLDQVFPANHFRRRIKRGDPECKTQ
jgi:hypothetical protein